MNDKLFVQDLIDILAKKHNLDKQAATTLVKEFFQLIVEALETDKYVKIKGLGTFRLIDVDSRESVNVNTGERFKIEGHTKVSFTPEQTLKELVNRPFSHFETVVLNENTVFDDVDIVEDIEVEETKPNTLFEPTTQTVSKESPVVEAETKVMEETSEPDDEAVNKKDDIIDNNDEEGKEQPLMSDEVIIMKEVAIENGIIIESQNNSDASAPKSDSSNDRPMTCFIMIVAFIVLTCGLSVVLLYYPDWQQMIKKPNQPITNIESNSDTIIAEAIIDTVSMNQSTSDTFDSATQTQSDSLTLTNSKSKPTTTPQNGISINKKLPIQVKVQPQSPIKTQNDTAGYIIIGTQATHILKEGETLTRVALRFFGTKAMWTYIVKHNPDVIKNPDNVPIGTKIKIPKLDRLNP